MMERLHAIRKAEQTSAANTCSDDDLEMIVQASAGDMRRAVLLMQAAMETGRCTEIFDLSHVQKSGAIFNSEKLDWFNKEYIKKMTADDFEKKALERVPKDFRKNPVTKFSV